MSAIQEANMATVRRLQAAANSGVVDGLAQRRQLGLIPA